MSVKIYATNDELEELRERAGIIYTPTQLTYEARYAVSGESVFDGRMAYNWEDKPHRVVHELCEHIEWLHWELKNGRNPFGEGKK